MKYDRFEQVPVWQAAMDLARKAYALTRNRALASYPELRDQLRRASLSVSNNIAEGFERGTTAELLSFLYIARGSAGEVRSMMHFTEGLPECANLKSEIADLKSLAESCSRQIRGWTEHLQNTNIPGPRRLNDRTRSAYEGARKREGFLKHLRDITDAATRERQEKEQQESRGESPEGPET